jgi:hypothetical protein
MPRRSAIGVAASAKPSTRRLTSSGTPSSAPRSRPTQQVVVPVRHDELLVLACHVTRRNCPLRRASSTKTRDGAAERPRPTRPLPCHKPAPARRAVHRSAVVGSIVMRERAGSSRSRSTSPRSRPSASASAHDLDLGLLAVDRSIEARASRRRAPARRREPVAHRRGAIEARVRLRTKRTTSPPAVRGARSGRGARRRAGRRRSTSCRNRPGCTSAGASRARAPPPRRRARARSGVVDLHRAASSRSTPVTVNRSVVPSAVTWVRGAADLAGSTGGGTKSGISAEPSARVGADARQRAPRGVVVGEEVERGSRQVDRPVVATQLHRLHRRLVEGHDRPRSGARPAAASMSGDESRPSTSSPRSRRSSSGSPSPQPSSRAGSPDRRRSGGRARVGGPTDAAVRRGRPPTPCRRAPARPGPPNEHGSGILRGGARPRHSGVGADERRRSRSAIAPPGAQLQVAHGPRDGLGDLVRAWDAGRHQPRPDARDGLGVGGLLATRAAGTPAGGRAEPARTCRARRG